MISLAVMLLALSFELVVLALLSTITLFVQQLWAQFCGVDVYSRGQRSF
jgi:hypothetical protein